VPPLLDNDYSVLCPASGRTAASGSLTSSSSLCFVKAKNALVAACRSALWIEGILRKPLPSFQRKPKCRLAPFEVTRSVSALIVRVLIALTDFAVEEADCPIILITQLRLGRIVRPKNSLVGFQDSGNESRIPQYRGHFSSIYRRTHLKSSLSLDRIQSKCSLGAYGVHPFRFGYS